MRFGLAALWLIAGLLAAGPAHATADLRVMRVGRIGIVTFGGEATVVSAGRGALVIETDGALPADAVGRLAELRALVTRVAVDRSRLRLTLAPGVQTTSNPLANGGLTVSLEPAGRATSPATTSGPSPATQAGPRAVHRPRARPAAPQPTPLPPAEPVPVMPEPAAAPIVDGVEVAGGATPGGAELRFAWPAPVRAAVFQRGDTLWAAFDTVAERVHGLDGLADAGLAEWLEPLPPATTDGTRVFRFRLRRDARAEAAQDGRTWRIRLTREASEPASAAGLVRDQDAGTLHGPAATRALDLTDPDTGERLGALLAAGGSLRQPAAVRLVDLELLPAAQGLAWAPLADGITVAAGAAGFTLGREGGLRLSGSAEAAAPTPTSTPPGTLLGLPALAGTDPTTRQQARLAIAGRIAGLAPPDQALARLDQVRLLLADGLGPEARATLERPLPAGLSAADRVPVERSRAAMAAAAAALEGQHGRALAGLLEPELDGDREVALWRAFAAAGAGQHPLAAREWRRGGPVLGDYPLPLRLTLGLKIAESLAQGGATDQARDLHDRLRPAADGTDRARLDLVRGVAATRTEQPVLAEQTLGAAAAGGDADTRVRAEFLLAASHHEQGTLDDDAAAALGAQRPTWRGHPWEARMLRELGRLQMRAGDPLASFATTLEAANRPGDPAEAAAAAADLRGRLKEVIRAAVAGTASPLAAIALHRSYGDLLAGDPEAPALRRQLAGLAAAAGLDESAAALARRAGATPAPASDDARRQLEAAIGAGDWPLVARAAQALLDRHPADAALPEEDAPAVVWLALAHARTGAPADAAKLTERYGPRLPEGRWEALLGLVAGAATQPGRGQGALAAADALVRTVRERLDQLEAPGGA